MNCLLKGNPITINTVRKSLDKHDLVNWRNKRMKKIWYFFIFFSKFAAHNKSNS
jgi:hypothetical protein